jgi:hypothetical protein
MNTPVLTLSLLAFSMLLCGGCASQSAWEQNVRRSASDSTVALAPLDKVAPVLVRDVSWDRLQNTLAEIEAGRAASDVHVSEWSVNQKNAEKANLLHGLQISQNPAAVTMVAHSQFKTTDNLGDPQATLPEVARKLGANMVVYSTRVLGKADKIVQEPVNSNKFGTVWYRDRDDRYRNDSYNEQQTTWVPVRVSADEVGAMAFFLRVE